MNSSSNLLSPSADVSHDFDFDFDFLPVDPLDSSPAISLWELVNPSDADPDSDSDVLSDFDYDFYLDLVPVASVEIPPPGNSAPSIDHYISGEANPHPSLESDVSDSGFVENVAADGDGYEYRHKYDYDVDDEEEEEEDEYDDGLDDELVPRHMRGKLGRERLRKLGMRGCSKMNTSKKSPFLYVKRGCLHGKHCFGIGLKNTL
ncbi:hypothetical protein MLD38_023397 [Melastoma candidum]|uniref:Uncharacterized protein n=1 Tax=Melastoma candidum TaxID=119954 RepID=A0ACB9QNK8_9MYRT|nr:hypothetical protein MLD38_023397 [Melastoma candidum]